MKKISFRVDGKPEGKARPRFSSAGKFARVYTPDNTRTYEKLIGRIAAIAMSGKAPIINPVEVSFEICAPIPKSWSMRKKQQAENLEIRPASKPDIDNVIKAYLDAMNTIVYQDDKQICAIKAERIYSNNPGVTITVIEIG